MRYMERDGYCGPASIVNAIRCYGQKVPEDKVAKACGTTKNGTDEIQMLRGIKKLGYRVENFFDSQRVNALDFIRCRIEVDRVPIILAVDNHSHYLTLVGHIGNTYLIADPAAHPHIMLENGVLNLSERELMNRWGGCKGHKACADKYTGIVVWK